MSLTQESVLSFLLERGGQVRNCDLVNHFRSLIHSGDPAEKQQNRELFKRLVNSVAVVRQSDGLKLVVVRKRYQDFIKDEKPEPRFSSPNNNSTPPPPPPVRAAEESDRRIYPEEQNSRARVPSSTKHAESPHRRRSSSDSTTLKVLNLPGDQPSRARRSGAVFAVIAVKSPERGESAPAAHQSPDQPKPPPMPADKFSFCNLKSWGTRQTEGSPLTRPPSKSTRPADDESVPLDPLAHEWLVKCAAGLWGSVYALLLRDTRLVQRKDFMSGFTALHWAAKDGDSGVLHKLLEISGRRGADVNVNSKSHGGYTPLHIAAMHGHAEVAAALVQRYGASVNERDDSGRKALHYLEEGAPAEVRGLLGGPLQGGEKTEDEQRREQHKGFNTISKLFHPHTGRRHKASSPVQTQAVPLLPSQTKSRL